MYIYTEIYMCVYTHQSIYLYISLYLSHFIAFSSKNFTAYVVLYIIVHLNSFQLSPATLCHEREPHSFLLFDMLVGRVATLS